MKTTGIVRKVDELGRIVLPIELRRSLDIEQRDPVEICLDGDRIILRKHESCCLFCGAASSVISYKGKLVCRSCIRDLNRA